MNFVSFWRNCERMGFVSSVFGVRCERMAFVSFWRTCERMAFLRFGEPVNVWISSVFGVPVNVWVSSRQFLAYL